MGPGCAAGGTEDRRRDASSFVHTDPDEGDAEDRFLLDSARLYVSGSATKNMKFMFNTEYNGASNDIGVLDAVAQFAFSPKFNVWVGRFLPPSDRANLYGPYYAHHWAVYHGRRPGRLSVHLPGPRQRRDVLGPVRQGEARRAAPSTARRPTGDDNVIAAGRVQVDFWDAEAGYYLNGTYYGDKNLLAIGGAGQVQGERQHGLQRRLPARAEVSAAAACHGRSRVGQVRRPRRLQRPATARTTAATCSAATCFRRWSVTGQFQVLGKFAQARFREGSTRLDVDYDQKTTEFNLNYVIKQFNARVMLFYKDTRFDAVQTDIKQFGVGLQIQM